MIDINHIESYVENNRIEAKKALGGLPHSIWETYSAFANTLGGVILLGVEEYRDKSFHTVDLPSPEELVEEFKMLLPLKVSVNILSDEDISIKTVNKNRIVVINVPRAARFERPVFIDKSPYGGTYRRGGEGDYRCSNDEIDAMFRDASIVSQDMAYMDYNPEDTDSVSLLKYRDLACLGSEENPEVLLEYLGALKLFESGLKIRSGAFLMFGTFSAIRKMYKGFSLKYTEGSISEEYPNLFEYYIGVKEKFSRYSMLGTDIYQSMTEALLNCIINSDYNCGFGVSIECSESKITFSNPGSFRIDIERAVLGGISDPRNSFIKKLFKNIKADKTDFRGISGIYRAWYTNGLSAPVIIESFSPPNIEFTLPFIPREKSRDTDLKSNNIKKSYIYRGIIVSYLTERASSDLLDLSQYLGLDTISTKEIMDDMIYDGIVEFSGNMEYKLQS